MRKRLTVILLVMGVAVGAGAQTDDLLISEYVEGSGSNHALEIYNGTSDLVDLSAYTIDRYSNGAASPVSIALPAVDLEPGEVFVVAHTSFSQPGLADLLSVDLNFDGNDALVLAYGGVAVDRIGRVAEDPGEYWSCASGNTQNHTLRRLVGVCAGSTVPGDPFDPCEGWEFFAVDTFSGLGDHVADCGTVDVVPASWGATKALYR